MRATPFARGRNCICTENGQLEIFKVSRFWCQLANEFSELASRLSDFGQVRLSKVSMESLILAQDKRWRRA